MHISELHHKMMVAQGQGQGFFCNPPSAPPAAAALLLLLSGLPAAIPVDVEADETVVQLVSRSG
jgi:hypothetical protein